MEQSTIIETLETSLLVNIWAERLFIIFFIVATAISIYVHGTLFQYFEVMSIFFLFVGIFFLGFVAIAAHLRYYFHFERRRKVELHPDLMVITVNDKVVEQIFKKDIINITLYDKRHVDTGNLFPVLLDTFYYLVVTGKNQETVVLTCLLDIRLKKKITAWYGQELEHTYQFFPFPNSEYR
jgi:hypothetical protein